MMLYCHVGMYHLFADCRSFLSNKFAANTLTFMQAALTYMIQYIKIIEQKLLNKRMKIHKKTSTFSVYVIFDKAQPK